jgi:hypothetical protein
MRSALVRLAEESKVPEWAETPADAPLRAPLPETLATAEDEGLSRSQLAA